MGLRRRPQDEDRRAPLLRLRPRAWARRPSNSSRATRSRTQGSAPGGSTWRARFTSCPSSRRATRRTTWRAAGASVVRAPASASAPPVAFPTCVASAFPALFVMAAPWSGRWTGWSWQTRFSGLPGSRHYSVVKPNSHRDISASGSSGYVMLTAATEGPSDRSRRSTISYAKSFGIRSTPRVAAGRSMAGCLTTKARTSFSKRRVAASLSVTGPGHWGFNRIRPLGKCFPRGTGLFRDLSTSPTSGHGTSVTSG